VRRALLAAPFLLCSYLAAIEYADPGTPPGAWFTGPLIAPTPQVVPVGHFNINTYFITGVEQGMYDKHWHAQPTPNLFGFTPQLYAYIGLTEWLDFEFFPGFSYRRSQGSSSTVFQDLQVGFGFQLLQEIGWAPAIKVALLETFPTGKYQHLNPTKHGTDEGGLGAYTTVPQLIFFKIFHVGGVHYLTTQLSFEYGTSTAVNVTGLNAYGGSPTTKGRVHPGDAFSTILSFEYRFAEHWNIAIDNVYLHTNKNRFSGNPGGAPVGDPSSEQFSFAPALEYDLNEHFGVIGGYWFSAWGRNSVQFQSGLVNIYYSY
jgi:hypothetical protein